MPLYQYWDEEKQRVVELVKAVSERDLVAANLRRITVPQHIGLAGELAGLDPATPEAAVPRALRALEFKQDHREIARLSGYSTERMKRIWQM